MRRTFRANAHFFFEYERYVNDEDDPQQAVDIDQQLFEEDPMGLHREYNFISAEVDIEDITNMVTPEENAAMSSMEPRLECAIRDWWSNRCEQDALRESEAKITEQRRELFEEAETLSKQISDFTKPYSRHLMLNVFDDYFVILVWNPEYDTHTIEVMRNELGEKS